jgi:hypothetical protein
MALDLPDQPGLSNACLARNQSGLTVSVIRLFHQTIQYLQIVLAADQEGT